MLYSYKVMNEDYDNIIVKTTHTNITEQLYYKDGKLVKHDLLAWKIEYGRISYCGCESDSIVILPPTINKANIGCIGKEAFEKKLPKTLVILQPTRMTLEIGSVSSIPEVISYAWLKRSQITNNIKIFGKVLEDV